MASPPLPKCEAVVDGRPGVKSLLLIAEDEIRALRLALEEVLAFCDGLDSNPEVFGEVTSTIRQLVADAYSRGRTIDNEGTF
jgi:hypothetical protein